MQNMLLDEVRLPYPPSVNHYWMTRVMKNGKRGRYLSKRAKDFCEAVKLLCGRKNPYTGRVGVRVDVYPPDKRPRDLDNLLKGTFDSIAKAGVILDDCQIDDLQVRRQGVHSGGYIVVWMWGITND